jgi:hypothetical protein
LQIIGKTALENNKNSRLVVRVIVFPGCHALVALQM